jgi:hypothetical protein
MRLGEITTAEVARDRRIQRPRRGYNALMEKVARVESVEESQTRSGNTRYVLRDSDGTEYTTFRPQIGSEAAKYEGKPARIQYHEEERNGFQNVYLDGIEPAPGEAASGPHDESADEVAWKATIEAAPWLLGSDHPDREVPPEELFDKLQPFKELVSEDIEDGDER